MKNVIFILDHFAMWLTAPDLGDHPTTLLLLNISWYYLILRLSECIETVLFVLRKRFRQVTSISRKMPNFKIIFA